MMTPVSAGMGSASQVAPWEMPDGPSRGDRGPVTFQSWGGGRNGVMAPRVRLQKVEAFGKGVVLPWGSWGTRPFPSRLLRTVLPRPGGHSRGSADQTCMRTCAKINGCAYELMIAEQVDAACPCTLDC